MCVWGWMPFLWKVLRFTLLHIEQFGKVLYVIKDLCTYLQKHLQKKKTKGYSKYPNICLSISQLTIANEELLNFQLTMLFNLTSFYFQGVKISANLWNETNELYNFICAKAFYLMKIDKTIFLHTRY